MARIDGGDLVARSLKRAGVKHIFALSGDYDQAIFDACLDEDIRIIDTRHEQAAVHMADGWARVTGEPGVAVVTAGPGVVDTIAGLASAYHSGSPLLLISGRIPMSEWDTGFGMDFDQVQLLRPVTKWAATCYDIARVPEYIATAYRQAITGRPGPVFLDIPSNILEAKLDEEQATFFPFPTEKPRPRGDPALIAQAVEILAQAQRPLAVGGSGVWWSGAGQALQEFIEVAQIPIILSQMGRGCVPEDHPLCFGPLRVGAAEADVILVVGARLNFWLNRGRPPLFGTNQKWIQIDIEGSEIGRNRPVDIGIVGDAREVLREMARLAKGRLQPRTDWTKECQAQARTRQERIEGDLNSSKTPIHPLRLCREVRGFLGREATLVMDGGDIAVFGAMALRSYHPGHWLDQGNLGLLGSGIPFALAARLARPKDPVLVLQGDGSFGLNGMEMDTAVRHNLPMVVVIGNDGAWGMIKHRQELIYGPDRVVGTELGFTHYEKMVEAMGGVGFWVERPEEIRPALEKAFASGRPACVNVKTDPTAVSPATRRTATRRG